MKEYDSHLLGSRETQIWNMTRVAAEKSISKQYLFSLETLCDVWISNTLGGCLVTGASEPLLFCISSGSFSQTMTVWLTKLARWEEIY